VLFVLVGRHQDTIVKMMQDPTVSMNVLFTLYPLKLHTCWSSCG